jgi:2'-deoxynucleoside 5'-phosphate N-hydrolase
MLVYFTASIVGKRHYLANYQKIIDVLKSSGCHTISDHILKVDESQIRIYTKKERIKLQEQLNKWISSCDCMIAETSFPSISVGFEISLALSRGKPVLILYSSENSPSLLVRYNDEKLICEKYSIGTAGEIIKDFLNYVRGTEDARFTFYITSEISTYLEDVSKKEKLPKAVYLRKLIEKDRENHTKSS